MINTSDMKRILFLISAILLSWAANAQNQSVERALPSPYSPSVYAEISRGEFLLNGHELNEWETRQVIGNEIYSKTFAPARRQRKAGLVLTIVGGVTTGLGGIIAIGGAAGMAATPVNTWQQDSNGRTQDRPYSYQRDYSSAQAALLTGTGIFLAGSTMLSVGIPLLVIGQKRLNWVAEDYQEKMARKASLNLSSGSNGVGLSLAF